MLRNNEDMIILSSTYVSFESSATVEPRQRISDKYIYLYVSDKFVFIGSEFDLIVDAVCKFTSQSHPLACP